MSPIVAVTCSALEHAAGLIEKGMAPAKALRQAAGELRHYAEAHGHEPIPSRTFELGERRAA